MDTHDTAIKSKSVDCRGLACPLPILHVRLALNTMRSGEMLDILADDPTFDKDFQKFCHLASITLLTSTRITPTLTFYQVQVR